MFTDPSAVASYADKTRRNVPGYSDLHRMAHLLLSERAGKDARILVLGAGGGLELKAFAEARADWSFMGVDPSQPMLDLAARVLGPLGSRVELRKGYVEDVPAGQFDGATGLLLLHFFPKLERLRVLPRATVPPQTRRPADRRASLQSRSRAGRGLARPVGRFRGRSAGRDERLQNFRRQHGPKPHASVTAGEEALLRDAGFSNPALFYAALSFRGWVAYAEETLTP